MVAPLLAGALVGAGASLLGGAISSDRNRKQAHAQEDAQREFAQHGIRWKVADAKAAGIHPLYALGASTHSYSPVQINDSIGPAVSQAGQDLSRAYMATRTPDERIDAAGQFMLNRARESDTRLQTIEHQHRVQESALRIDNQMLQNEMLRLQLRRMEGQIGPGMPNSVSSSSLVKMQPSEQTRSDPEVPGREAYAGEGKPAMVPYRVGGAKYGFTLDLPTPNVGEGLEGTGPAAWPLGATLIGGHYLSKFRNWLDEQGPRKGYKRVFDPRTWSIIEVPQ